MSATTHCADSGDYFSREQQLALVDAACLLDHVLMIRT